MFKSYNMDIEELTTIFQSIITNVNQLEDKMKIIIDQLKNSTGMNLEIKENYDDTNKTIQKINNSIDNPFSELYLNLNIPQIDNVILPLKKKNKITHWYFKQEKKQEEEQNEEQDEEQDEEQNEEQDEEQDEEQNEYFI